MKKLGQCMGFMRDMFTLHEPVITESKSSDYELLLAAGQEVDNAHILLEEVTDPDLIDYAIYRLQAAEKRYDYLYKLIKASQPKRD